METTRNIVAIGHGYWGKNIARNLYQLGALYGVCEVHDDMRNQVAQLYPDIKLFNHPDQIWEDENVKGVAISTPAETHAVLTMKAMEAGRDVFVEKPLALTQKDGEDMVAIAQKTERILMVGHLLEYHPAVLALAELVQSGELGRLQYIYSNRLNLGKFRQEENILWSFAPHDIAVVLKLVQDMPIEVISTGGAYLQPNVADTTVTNLLFDNGVRAHIFVSWLHPYKEQKLVVVGSRKMVVFDDREEEGKKLMLIDKGANWIDNQLIPRQGEATVVPYPNKEPLKEEMSHFIACMQNRTQPQTDGENGIRVLRVLQAAQKSLQTGGNKVQL